MTEDPHFDAVRVAVVIPCFNHGEYVGEAVASALRQTHPQVECVVVDDGSTDPATREALQHLAGQRIQLISQEHRGLPGARNTGIKATTAPFFVPLDADDHIAPEFISKCLPALLANRRLGYCYTHLTYFGARRGVCKCPAYDPAALPIRNLSAATALVRRAAFDAVGGYSEEMRYGLEDWDFWLALLAAGYAGACHPEALFHYRKHKESSLLSSTARYRPAMVRRMVAHHARLYASVLDEAQGDAAVDELYERFLARAELDQIENGRLWRWCRWIVREGSRAPEEVKSDAPGAPSPQVRLRSLRSAPAYRMVRAIKATRLFQRYARIAYGPYPCAQSPYLASCRAHTLALPCDLRADGLAPFRLGILTRTAGCGGAQSLISIESSGLDAPVIVAGGPDDPEASPFYYRRTECRRELRRLLEKFDVVLCHRPPPWAVAELKNAGKAWVQFVHHGDLPGVVESSATAFVTHSRFIAAGVVRTSSRPCPVVDPAVDTALFRAGKELGRCVGGFTRYEKGRGLEAILDAWRRVPAGRPESRLRFYGAGPARDALARRAREGGAPAELLPAVVFPWVVLREFRCFVIPPKVEALPLAALEAAAMDIPITGPDLPHVLEFNRLAEERGFSAPIILFRADDPQSLADAICAQLSNVSRPHTRPYIEKFHTPENHCRQLARVLASVLS